MPVARSIHSHESSVRSSRFVLVQLDMAPFGKGFGVAMSSSPLGMALERRRGRHHPVAGGGRVKMRIRFR